MRILILGGDGYLGWPTAMHFAAKGHDVWVIDNYLRRQIALETCSEALIPTPNLNERAAIFESLTGHKIHVTIGDCTDRTTMTRLFAEFLPRSCHSLCRAAVGAVFDDGLRRRTPHAA